MSLLSLKICFGRLQKEKQTVFNNLYYFLISTEVLDMNCIGEVIQAISIGLIVANFLFNTCRVLEAIELCKECLFILNIKEFMKEHELIKSLYLGIYLTMVQGYSIINDYTNGIKYASKLLQIFRECGERTNECTLSIKLATWYICQSKYAEAKELCEKALLISTETGHRNLEAYCYGNLGTVYQSVGEYEKAREYHEQALVIKKEIGDKKSEALSYGHLGTVLQFLGEYKKAREYHEKALAIIKDFGGRNGAPSYGNLGNVFQSIGEYKKAKEYYKKARGEALCYGNLGTVFLSLCDYVKAKEHFEDALEISKEIGDRKGQATFYGNLGTVFLFLCDYVKAKDHFEDALAISKEIGDRKGQATFYGNLGTVFQSVGEYEKAKEYLGKALAITTEIGDRKGEASFYGNLGTVFHSVGEYEKAKRYHWKALEITTEIGDIKGEATSYGNIGSAFRLFGEYDKAKEYLRKALAIRKEIGDREGEEADYGNLGAVSLSLGNYVKAKEHFEKALAIGKEIGDRKGEANSYGNLGVVFQLVEQYEKAKEYQKKALAIRKEIGDRNGEASSCGNLGSVFLFLGKYAKANEYLQKALAIRKEIGDREGEGTDYGNLGTLFQSIGDYEKARNYHEKALAITSDICDRNKQAANYLSLGTDFQFLGECVKAEENLKKGLALSEEIGDVKTQFMSLCKLAWVKLFEGKIQEALSYLLSSIQKCEDLRGFLRDNDQFKISFSDGHVYPYRELSAMFCSAGSLKEALYVSELGRARALADLMSTQYSVENQISANPQTWVGIERIMYKERHCTCVYLSYSYDGIYLWVLKASEVVHFGNVKVNGMRTEGLDALDAIFADKSFRGFGILPEEHCEDRTLKCIQQKPESCEEDSRKALRLGKGYTDYQAPKQYLSLCYKYFIAPVVNLLEGPEIIIVPERSLHNVPFAALLDESGKYLSETFRIRVVPSLTTLKLIQDSPADYHSQTGALIVGNPDVGRVRYKGRLKYILPLPCAENEANMVGEKLGVRPLLGQEATKQAVLQVINSVSLIHFAAHGDAERGEIALAPFRPLNRIPREEDFLLTMSDISQVRLRAKLVVLSCCHSGRGQIRAEGVVGIARAFLGSGARSVLAALWALEDSATEQFMSRFYEHLVCGQSASESLHEAMKWMRCNGYPEVRQWAPFMLIGDNVTFDLRNKSV
ncbi:uncharacterized protein LOC144643699 isoform X1 [Oculina patagonica]